MCIDLISKYINANCCSVPSLVIVVVYAFVQDRDSISLQIRAVRLLDVNSGGAIPGLARSNDLAGRSTALAQALAPRCLALRIALLR